jgi:hypothetical protein
MSGAVDLDPVGCAYILEPAGRCGAPRRPGSSYCADHHALCHLAPGSKGERSALQLHSWLARRFGGRGGSKRLVPSDRLLRRLEEGSR